MMYTGCTRKNGTRSENKMNAREDPTSHTPGPGQTFPRHKMKFRNGTGDGRWGLPSAVGLFQKNTPK